MTEFLGLEAQLAEAQRIAHLGSWSWDRMTDVVTCSREMLRLLAIDSAGPRISGEQFFARVHAADVARLRAGLEHAEHSSEPCVIDHAVAMADGKLRHVQTRAQCCGDAAERILVGTMQDVSERRELEQQLRHAQKMEALGRLAGGIAHDFNNLLAGIACNADLLLDGAPLSAEQHEEATEIRRAAERAALLTRQLLAFSRKQGFRPEVIDLNVVVRELERMLRRLLNGQVQLTCVLDSQPCWVDADRGQLEQALVNLVVNARDAMPDGGVVAIETRLLRTAEGEGIALIVRDDGIGMDAATQEHLFEPFFTTKSAGHGTGLGLAMVYGIVQQAGGTIRVQTAPGQGAEFRIVLPRTYRQSATAHEGERKAHTTSRGGTVLLIEDEAVVLDSIRRTLQRRSYRVLEARNSTEAMRLFQLHTAEIDVVLSDVIMPGIGGPELLSQMHARRPELPLILMSGYTRDSIDTGGLRDIGCRFIEKPFTRDALLDVLEDALRSRTPSAMAV